MKSNDSGWLVPIASRLKTPYSYRKGDRRIRPVEVGVIHFTLSPVASANQHGSDELRVRRWLRGPIQDEDPGRESATHFVSLRNGLLLQGESIEGRPWHAGGSVWRGEGDVNQRSIGLDLENVGPLTRGTNRWVNYYGGTYHGPEPYMEHEPYRVAQMVSMLQVVVWVVEKIPILEDMSRWVGHEAIRRGKGDPGLAFPWGSLREVLDGRSPGAIDWGKYPGVVDA